MFTQKWALLLSVLAIFSGASVVEAIIYDVGPGQSHEDLDSIPWLDLAAGDEVRIHYRSEAYRSKIGLRCRGTANQPIRIVGVASPAGERPILDGDNATTPTALATFFDPVWDEYLGVILIKRGPSDAWGHKPGFIEIEGLEIRNASPDKQYTAMDGTTESYADGAAAIWAVLAENLTIRDCEITGNGNGLFVLSKNEEEEVSRNILITGNHVHGNGVVGSDRQHEIYTQAAGVIFEYNRIGPLREGAGGSSLKDRSANTVIRYNWIASGARTLDLVDPEDSYTILTAEPGFSDTWVYGNIFVNEYHESRPFSTNLFHYGGDTGSTDYYRKGILHFFHNTVYVEFTQSQAWYFRLFDPSTNDEAVELHNNIFFLDGDSEMYLANLHGQILLAANNWINTGWFESRSGFDGSVTIDSAPLTGSDPGLTDSANHDFSVPSAAPVHDQAGPLPASVVAAHPLLKQYVEHLDGTARITEGAAAEIGAFETPIPGLIFADGFESGDDSHW